MGRLDNNFCLTIYFAFIAFLFDRSEQKGSIGEKELGKNFLRAKGIRGKAAGKTNPSLNGDLNSEYLDASLSCPSVVKQNLPPHIGGPRSQLGRPRSRLGGLRSQLAGASTNLIEDIKT